MLSGIIFCSILAVTLLIIKKIKVQLEFSIQDVLVLPLVLLNTAGAVVVVTLLAPNVADPIHAAMDAKLFTTQFWTNSGPLLVTGQVLAAALVVTVLFFLLLKRTDSPGASRTLRTALTAIVLGTMLSWTMNFISPTLGPSAFAQSRAQQVQTQSIQSQDSEDLSSVAVREPIPRDAAPPLPVLWISLALVAAWTGLKTKRLFFWGLLALGMGVTASGLLAGRYYLVDMLFVPSLAAMVWSLASVYLTNRPLNRFMWTHLGIVILATPALGFGLSLLGNSQVSSIYSILGFWAVLSVISARSSIRLAKLSELPESQNKEAEKSNAGRPKAQMALNRVLALFFFSGVTGLIYEVIFERELALIFGSTAKSTTTVLAVYMAGLALGAALGGRLSDRVKHPLRYYAIVEGFVGILCLFSPWLFDLANHLYLALVQDSSLSSTSTELIQVLCGALVVVIPALFMGTTMPLLAKHATDEMGMVKRNIAFLYSANTLGAACGTIFATYWLISTLGIDGALRFTTIINFSIAGAGLWLSKHNRKIPLSSPRQDMTPMNFGGSYGIALIVTAGIVGFTTFGLEILYVHLLAVVAGNSIYAFGLMLFAFLIGLGTGSKLIGHMKLSGSLRRPLLASSILFLGIVVLLLLPLWDRIPPFFGLYSRVDFAGTFAQREFIRFSVCVGMMIVPTVIIGMIFPQMVSLSTQNIDSLGRHVGMVSFSNTLGDILGATIVGLVLLPYFGSYRTIQLLGMAAIVLGAVLLLWESRKSKWLWVGGGILAGLAIVSLQGGWNMSTLTAGTNVYFTYQSYGNTVEYRESVDGGISSIARSNKNASTVTTMLTNGKFQGDDHDEMLAQCRFAFYPLLHCENRNKALLIGLGTGVTGGVLLAAGFKSLDIAELSADIAYFARKYFSHVNGHVLDDPRTSLHISDGRNFLLLGKKKYDLVSIEISSIWFAGAANLYNKEFYGLVRDHLLPNGVLQQWIQLHHISPADVASILWTIKSIFPHVALYFGGHQGILVASMEPLKINADYIRQKLQGSPELSSYKKMMGPQGFYSLLDELLLKDDEIDDFVKFVSDSAGISPHDLLSTDSNRRLEYSTPKGNVRPHGMQRMADLLSRFKSRVNSGRVKK